MIENDYVVVYITAANEEEARSIAEGLIAGKNAACVNIIPGVRSLFRWQGKIEEANEHLLIVKTRAALLQEVARIVKSLHSYEVPEIIALPVVDGNPDYLDWLSRETEGR